MEIHWLATDPTSTGARLRRVLGGEPEGTIALVNATIDVRRGADRFDRLDVLFDDVGPTPAHAAPGASARFALVAIGVATVDTERFAAANGWQVVPLPSDPLLGASVALAVGRPIVLLEPNTEGRLAATLARVGEAPVAIYARPTGAPFDRACPDPARRAGPNRVAPDGPFGRACLAAGGSAWGPHLILVASGARDAGTIAR